MLDGGRLPWLTLHDRRSLTLDLQTATRAVA